ncbi:PBSX family phage terminase large subunit [Elizabethkingia anophelis]|uniref:PBSX family phage terminase large subunit n=1 Tax=Elizabethkingia anophelis TaxID=1117645 RepID=UPI003892B542
MQKKIKLSEKYEPLFELLEGKHPDVDIVIVTGGRNSQKSFGVGTWSCVSAKDYFYNILYTRYTLSSAEDSIIPEFKEKIELLDAENFFDVVKDRIRGQNDSKIVFRGIKTSSGNQTASLKSLKNFNVFILEEAEEMPSYNDWDKINKSIRSNEKQNISILILNPTTKEHWIYTEFFEQKGVAEGFNGIVDNVMYIHSTYLDMDRELIADNIWNNFEERRLAYEEWINLSPAKQESSPLKKKALYYKHVVLGGWLDKAEGVIFTNWKIGEFQNNGKTIYGQDYGFSVDPTTLIEVSIFTANKKIFLRECFYKPKLTTSDIFDLNKKYAGKGLIVADSAEPRLIEELRVKGLNIIETIKGQGSVTAGISLMQDYELIIDPGSTNIIKELNNYVWNDKKSSTPIDAYNHALDAIRYAVAYELTNHNEVFFF